MEKLVSRIRKRNSRHLKRNRLSGRKIDMSRELKIQALSGSDTFAWRKKNLPSSSYFFLR
jgi:hypothetical protein